MTTEQWTKPPEDTVPVQEPVKEEVKAEVKPAKTYTEAEYKGIQRSLNKLQGELEQAKAVGASLDEVKNLREEIRAIKGGLELVIQNYGKIEGTEGYEPLAPQYARLTAAQAQEQAIRITNQKQIDETVADIRELAEDAGLETNAPELKDVWKAPTAREALVMARRIIKKIETEKLEQKVKETLREESKKSRQELGLDSADTSTPSGKRGGRRPSVEELHATPAVEAMKKYSSGEWSDK